MPRTLVVAFAFGSPGNILPNVTIGGIASWLAKEYSTNVFAQKDVPLDAGVVAVRFKNEDPRQPPSTFAIARQAVGWASLCGAHTIEVVAAAPHMHRCIYDLKLAARERDKERFEVVACYMCTGIDEAAWFCSYSQQLRTRSPKVWWLREIILRALWLVPPLYKWVAK